MSQRIPVTDKHPDHYLTLAVSDDSAAVWWDGFTGLTIVVTAMSLGLRGAVGAGLLVSVIDRTGYQTFAWAFHADSSTSYIAEKIPPKVFNKTWQQRLAQSIALALRLHQQATAPASSGSSNERGS